METERLIIRDFELRDAPFILRLLNEPSFIDNIADKGVRTLEDAADYLMNGPLHSYETHGHGLYLVLLKQSQQPIGMCGLLKRDQFDHADLGYAFLPEYWSMGYALEAASSVLGYGRESLGHRKTLAIVSPGNAPSIRLLEKLGFSFVGFMQMEPDEPDVALYEFDHPT